MNAQDMEFKALLLSLVDAMGMTKQLAEEGVNGTVDSDFLGWYDESDLHRHQVCASFHMLGQEILRHCSPIVALITANELKTLRNNLMDAMKELPK